MTSGNYCPGAICSRVDRSSTAVVSTEQHSFRPGLSPGDYCKCHLRAGQLEALVTPPIPKIDLLQVPSPIPSTLIIQATDPSIYPLQPSSTNPQRPLLSLPGGSRPPSMRPTSRRPPPPPEVCDRRWPVGFGAGHVHWEFTLARPVWAHPGGVHFSQDQRRPISYIPQPCSGLTGLKGL